MRTLICFVETWADVSEPTPLARVAQARALIQLGMMDRAWARLRGMVDTGEGGVDALALAARMFISRGWNNQARRSLKKALAIDADNDKLRRLWDEASEPPTKPDYGIAEHDDPEPKALLSLAEHLMATGSFVKARGLLERVKRKDPENGRVDDLLWAMEGDYHMEGANLAELTDLHGPDLAVLADLTDEPEHTAELDPTTIPQEREEAESSSAFPNLFRNMEAKTEAWVGTAEQETTQVAAMADLDAMKRRSEADTLPPTSVDPPREDTQILRVVHRAAPTEKTTGDTDRFDLSDLNDVPDGPSDYGPELEPEDDDLIVHTRREITEPTDTQATDISGLNQARLEEEVAQQKHPKGEDDAEAADWVRSAAEPEEPEPPAPTPSAPKATPRRKRPTQPNNTTWWLVATVAGVVVTSALLGMLLLYQLLSLLLS